MPTEVVVLSGMGAGTKFPVEKHVTRIGSATQMDFVVPNLELPRHALTLEYRDGQYHVFNRLPQPVKLEGNDIPPQGSAVWPSHKPLELPGNMALELQSTGDPAPSRVDPRIGLPLPEGDATDAGGEEDEEVARSEKKTDSKTIFQLAVIAVCIVGCGLLIAYKNMEPPEAETAELPERSEIVQACLESPNVSPEIVQSLQYAELAMVRGDKEKARERFDRLRDVLLWNRETTETSPDRVEDQLLAYVVARLGDL
jgi:hypothetical protein